LSFLKIAAGGAEVEVSRGLSPLLERGSVRNIYIEIDELNLKDFGYSVSELYHLFNEYH
jgi:hypothetical protein